MWKFWIGKRLVCWTIYLQFIFSRIQRSSMEILQQSFPSTTGSTVNLNFSRIHTVNWPHCSNHELTVIKIIDKQMQTNDQLQQPEIIYQNTVCLCARNLLGYVPLVKRQVTVMTVEPSWLDLYQGVGCLADPSTYHQKFPKNTRKLHPFSHLLNKRTLYSSRLQRVSGKSNVELRGIEPLSKHIPQKLSTCLFHYCLSATDRK